MLGLRVRIVGWHAIVGLACWTLSASGKPNFLLLVSEDNGPELGCYGDPFVRTPVLDRLAESGVLFKNAYVPQAGCSQSRAALYTGLYPHQNGHIGLATWKFRLYRPGIPNLVRSLKSSGYRTGIVGKLHMNPESAFPFDFEAISGSNFSRRHLARYAEEAGRFIKASEEPFFLSVNYPDAHRPFLRSVEGLPERPLTPEEVVPLPCFGLDTPELRRQTADYYNSMMRLDALIGGVLETLQASGKADQTVVIYMGDHGADLLRGKRTSYEGGVRVPLIIRWPASLKRLGGGRVVDQLVSTLDLYPTLLDLAQARVPQDLSGQSLVPLLENPDHPWRRYLFTEYHLHSAHNFYPQRTIRDERFKLIWNLQPGELNPGYGFTMKRFFEGLAETISSAPRRIREAYLRMERPGEFELYDLESDPHEFHDLSVRSEYVGVFKRLKSELLQWRRLTSDPLLEESNLRRLRSEVLACFRDGVPDKSALQLNYPDYFFANQSERQ